ncbi:MAG: response regulator [Desulfovibrio sp.]|jgi:PAS domain S-box-containing protein|nr:response regulator [Desulfovibrio sp.]
MGTYKQLLDAIFDASPYGIIVLSESTEKSYANSVYSALFPGREKLRYNSPLDDVRDFYSKYIANADALVELIADVRRTGKFRKRKIYGRDGGVLHAAGRVIKTPDGAATEVWTFRDITEQCRQDEQLQLRLQLVTAVLNASGDAIFTIVEGLETPLANDRYTSIFPGWKEALRYGQPLKEVGDFFSRHLIDWEVHVDLVAKVRQSGEYHQAIIHHKDGRIIHMSGKMVNAGFIRRGALEIYTLRDITGEVRSRQKMQAMQLTVDNLSEPVVWSDLKGKITYVNQAACAALGYAGPAEMIGKTVWRFIKKQQFDAVASGALNTILAAPHENSHIKIDHTILARKDGAQLPCTILIDYIAQGGKPFWAMCFHDLSEQLQRIEAERAAEAKTNFLAKMSHEMRTPLNSIIGMTEMLIRKINVKDMYHGVYEYVSVIQQSGRALLAIVNDLLDFSKITSGNLWLNETTYSFASLMNDVINIAGVQIVENKPLEFIVHVDADIPYELYGDEVRVRQILVNLLSNAIKYTDSGFVKLDVRMVSRSGEDKPSAGDRDTVTLSLSVKDTGSGISAEDQEIIFSEFRRLDDRINQKTEGTGLGLPIVRSLCRLMGGDIKVVSEYGSGSEFIVTIRQQAGTPKKLASVTDAGGKRVLLFKGQEAQHEALAAALGEFGLPEPTVVGKERCYFVKEFISGRHDYAFITTRNILQCFRSCEQQCFELCQEEAPGTKLVIMASMGDMVTIPGASCITMPVYCVPLANILNGAPSPSRFHSQDDFPSFSAPSATVLVADDVATNLRVAQEFIACYDINVEVCMDGAEALKMVASKRYDLVFMDNMMPVMNGLDATLKIRQMGKDDGYFKNVPIVALTANAVVGQKEIFLAHGFTDFLPKPFESRELDVILRKWIPQEKQRQASRVVRNDRPAVPNGQPVEVKGLDIAKGIKNAGGRKSAYADILSTFRQDCGKQIHLLRTALAGGDLPTYTISAHALKGSLRTIGAEQLAFSALMLENAAAGGDVGFLQEETGSFVEDLQALVNAFDLVLPRLGVQEADMSALKLDVLRNALVGMDARAVNALLTEYQDMALSAGQRKFIGELDMLVMAFEFEEAVKKIDDRLA